jgi:solute carrier family 25 protein 44
MAEELVEGLDGHRPGSSASFDELDKPFFFGVGAALYTGLTVALYPLHSQKTRAQAAIASGGGASMGGLGQLFAPGAFRGLSAAVMGALPARMGYIFALETGSLHSTRWLAERGMRAELASSIGGAVGGASAAMTSMVMYIPFDIVSQQQIVHPSRPDSALAIATRIAKAEGVGGLYRGLGITVLTYLPSSALWWGTYKATHEGLERASPCAPPLLVELGSGAFAGVLTSTLTAPLDTVKTRTQIQGAGGGPSHGFLRVARELYAAGGARALWRGVFWRGTHTVVWGCTMVVCYEQLKRWAVKSPSPSAGCAGATAGRML